ncbi:polysaccharide biosynthesis protein [Ideonella sp. YS5]|uniref:polysaccharide biosynthesis protein n=1 Tax=Ideonella sp. YS5 TaxID=3453714 RepID=UPI003EEB0674
MAEPQASSPSVWLRLERAMARIRPYRRPLSLVIDAVVIVLCWNLTYLFRLGFERWLSARPAYDLAVMAGVTALYLIVFIAVGVPRGMWRFSGFDEVGRLTIACGLAGLASAVVVLMLQLREVPRAVLALHPVLSLMGLCMVRIAYRMLYEHARARIAGGTADMRRAIVFGAGDAARRLLAGIHRQGWIVLGLLDDDPAKQGARVAGVPVIGPLDAVLDKGVRGSATHVIVAMPSASAAQRRRAVALASEARLPVLTVPSAEELSSGGGSVDRLRDIEPEDLLGREPVRLDEAGIAESLAGKTVLVTGAGGSIGSELCRQVARLGPARLVLYELSEYNLYAIEQDLGERFPALELVRLIGDVKDLDHLRVAFARWRPQVVFHAAAFKHVPLMEEDHNAWAALRNNTLGTYHAALAAAEHRAERFVLISTDKAVNPTNVMGATKRAAELVVSAMAAEHPRTRFMAVRFGNVLGSSGSVIPKFKEQIAKGGPVTVTHPDITRYFMTIPEATRLVLQAAAIGESGQVLVLDMGEPVKILDLARTMIRLAGRSEREVPIVFTGLRAGEKLYEELLADGDATIPTAIRRLRVARLGGGPSLVNLRQSLVALESAGSPSSESVVRDVLVRWVPEYRAAG